jgi:hypothetical protein
MALRDVWRSEGRIAFAQQTSFQLKFDRQWITAMSSGVSPTNFKTSRWPDGAAAQYVCPYCGAINEAADGQCPQCTMENTAAGRKATKARIGPWYVLQKRNPAAPGMKFETLLSFVNKGRVKAHSIIRGPTTHQLWKFAAQVRGLSREFGLCYSCSAEIDRNATICPKCNRAQTLPTQPDVFLESADGEIPATVFRELPASVAAPATEVISVPTPAAPEPIAAPMASEAQPASAAEAPEPPTPIEEAEPAVDATRDLIIPTLSEDPTPPIARPTSPRERLATLNKTMAAQNEPPELEDTGDSAFDDGPARPPGQVGPAFVAGGRGPQPAARRRKWPEAVMFVLVLVAALGSGLLYVDPALQKSVQLWVNNAMANIGVTPNPKSTVPPLAGTGAAPLPAAPPSSNSVRPIASPDPHASATSTPTPHVTIPPPPLVTPTPDPANVASSHTGSQPPAPVVSDTPPTSPTPATVVPSPAPTPAATDTATNSTDTSPPADDDPFTKARNLRRKAIDAENSGDYKAAVTLFEQIKELPRDTWPGDLELRLKAAKANAEGKPRH